MRIKKMLFTVPFIIALLIMWAGKDVQATDPNDEPPSSGNQLFVYLPLMSYVPSTTNQEEGVDTDGDGMPDEWETQHGLDPNDPSDGVLPDSWEHPLNFDPRDPDNDALLNPQEYQNSTNPKDFDTDDDLLPDGFEVNGGLNPLAQDDVNADPDADGLTNLREAIYGTNPTNPDTDSDTVNDGTEADQGSDPTNGSDGGQAPPEGELVELKLVVGDHSGSHSERYNLVVGPIRHMAPTFGQVEEGTYKFKRGQTYEVRIEHNGSCPNNCYPQLPDYDYTARIQPVGNAAAGVFIEDPDGIFGVHGESNPFFAAGKTAYVHILPTIELGSKFFETQNKCNFAPNKKQVDEHKKHLIVVPDAVGGDASFTAENVKVIPDNSPIMSDSRFHFGMKPDGGDNILSEGSISGTEITFSFKPADGEKLYTPVFGYDINSDGVLNPEESYAMENKEGLKLLGVSDSDYNERLDNYTNDSDLDLPFLGAFDYPLSRTLWTTFRDGTPPTDSQSKVMQDSIELTYSENESSGEDKKTKLQNTLAHGAGANFDDASCTASVKVYRFPKDSHAADLVTSNEYLRSNVETFIKEKGFIREFNKAKDNNPNSGSFIVKYKAVSFPYSRADVLNFDPELAFAIGAGLGDLDFDVTYTRSGAQYTLAITVKGLIYDTFDFRYGKKDGAYDINTPGATLQIGHGKTGRRGNAGGIFVTEIEFEKNFVCPDSGQSEHGCLVPIIP